MTDHQPGCGCTRCDQRRQCDAEFPVTPPRKVEFIIDLKALLDHNEALNKENANLRSVIIAIKDFAALRVERANEIDNRSLYVEWGAALRELRAIETRFFGREVTL